MNEEATFFKNQEEFRAWLHKNHQSKTSLWVGYFKKHTKLPSMTWSESVDQAICYGWIDGIRKKVNEERYKIRFTPRKTSSHWSAVNLKKIKELTEKNLMQPAGISIFEKRKESNEKNYAYENQSKATLPSHYLEQIKANAKAWAFFENLAPSYKKQSIWWVVSAKQEKTRLKRLNVLIESSEAGLKIPQMRKR